MGRPTCRVLAPCPSRARRRTCRKRFEREPVRQCGLPPTSGRPARRSTLTTRATAGSFRRMVEAAEHLAHADSSRAECRRRPGVRAGAAVAAGLALIVYINSLPNGFLSDDVQTIAFSTAAAGYPFNPPGLLLAPGVI